jgi:hypothetical protein
LLLLSGLALLLTSASGQPTPDRPATPPAGKVKTDPDAAKVLQKAIDELAIPDAGPGLKMDLWQEVDVQGLAFQSTGNYLAGPGERLRLDLTVRVGGTEGELKVICDGKTLWEIYRIGAQEPNVQSVDLQKVLADTMSDAKAAQTRQDFLQSQSFAGIAPLLKNLQRQISFGKPEHLTWKGHEVIRLTGTWADSRIEPKKWQEYLPRLCRLYLDAQTYWPHRLEWWGPTETGKDAASDSLLMQMEFRNPERPKDLAAAQFVYTPPASVRPTDRTEDFKTRARDMLKRSENPAP